MRLHLKTRIDDSFVVMFLVLQIPQVSSDAVDRRVIVARRLRSLVGTMSGLIEQLESTVNPALSLEQRRLMNSLELCGQNLDLSLNGTSFSCVIAADLSFDVLA